MERKYELTDETMIWHGEKTLHRIKALKDFGNVKKGDIGGYVENESNLWQIGECWIYDDAKVMDRAAVRDNAKIRGKSSIENDAKIYDDADIDGDVLVCENTLVGNSVQLKGTVTVEGLVEIRNNAKVSGDVLINGNACISGEAYICSEEDYATVQGFGSAYRSTTFFRTIDGGIGVQCGCFYGTLAEFRKKVKETHGDSKKAKEYLMIADLMEYRFSSEKE